MFSVSCPPSFCGSTFPRLKSCELVCRTFSASAAIDAVRLLGVFTVAVCFVQQQEKQQVWFGGFDLVVPTVDADSTSPMCDTMLWLCEARQHRNQTPKCFLSRFACMRCRSGSDTLHRYHPLQSGAQPWCAAPLCRHS